MSLSEGFCFWLGLFVGFGGGFWFWWGLLVLVGGLSWVWVRLLFLVWGFSWVWVVGAFCGWRGAFVGLARAFCGFGIRGRIRVEKRGVPLILCRPFGAADFGFCTHFPLEFGEAEDASVVKR